MNELIMNALGHVPDVIEYLSHIRNQSVFNFCAIPQVRYDSFISVACGDFEPGFCGT